MLVYQHISEFHERVHKFIEVFYAFHQLSLKILIAILLPSASSVERSCFSYAVPIGFLNLVRSTKKSDLRILKIRVLSLKLFLFSVCYFEVLLVLLFISHHYALALIVFILFLNWYILEDMNYWNVYNLVILCFFVAHVLRCSCAYMETENLEKLQFQEVKEWLDETTRLAKLILYVKIS